MKCTYFINENNQEVNESDGKSFKLCSSVFLLVINSDKPSTSLLMAEDGPL